MASAYALVPAAAVLLGVGLATVVYRVAPTRAVNRRLALLLLLEGLAGLPPLVFMLGGDGWPLWVESLSSGAIALQPAAYLAFLATLDTPLVRPLRRRWLPAAAASLALLAVAVEATLAATTGARSGAVGGVALLGILAVSVWGLAAAISLLRRAPPGSAARVRARAYVAAFGVRDAGWAVIVLSALAPAAFPPADGDFWSVAPPLVTVLYMPVLAYGLLRHQVLDFQLRVRWGIERGTIAAVFLAVYVAASQVARVVVEPRAGPWIGLAAAALLVLALVPLQRLAERLAAHLVTSEQVDRHKLEVYRAALEDAQASGAPDEARLDALRRALGISERDHAVLSVATRAPDADPAAAIERGGRFRIRRELGEGAFARAYLARDGVLDRDVVLKVLRRTGGDPEDVLREARALARVRHPNVLAIHDAGRFADRAFLVVEHAAGRSIAERFRGRPASRPELDRIAAGLLAGLGAVHAAGLVHRDVKPSNVLLSAEGDAKLADFGLAHVAGFEETQGSPDVGTLRYLAPEQARGAPASAATDRYGAALTLFEAAAGRPFAQASAGESATGLRSRIAAGLPYPPEGCGFPDLDPWFRRALAPEPAARFPSIEAMRDGLAVAPA